MDTPAPSKSSDHMTGAENALSGGLDAKKSSTFDVTVKDKMSG